jgi:hypothetical protein
MRVNVTTWDKKKVDEPLEVGQGPHALVDSTLYEDETLIITKND